MFDAEEMKPVDKQLESALSALAPARQNAARDRLMFEAGRRSAVRSVRAFQACAAVLLLGLTLSVVMQAMHRSDSPTQQAMPAPLAIEPPPQQWQTLGITTDLGEARSNGRNISTGAAYVKMRNDVLVKGVDALPKAPWQSAGDDNDDLKTASLGRRRDEPASSQLRFPDFGLRIPGIFAPRDEDDGL